MKVGQIIDAFRQRANDTVKPYLWGDPELIGYVAEAEEQACRRAHLLVDSTSTLCQIAVTSGAAQYDYDERIVAFRRAKLSNQSYLLSRRKTLEMDRTNADWETETGIPDHYINDYQAGALRFDRIPDEDDTLNLGVVRVPLEDVNDREDTPEIPARYHRGLIHWLMFRGYLKQDSQTRDEKKSLEGLAMFEAEFGAEVGAKDEQWDLENALVGEGVDDGAFR
jgi:hypothetical protein